MVEIYVGKDSVAYHIHRSILTDYSRAGPFFKWCLQPGSGVLKEGVENQLMLPDVSVQAFNLFIMWAYGAKIEHKNDEDEGLPLLQLWVLAERFGMESLMNEAIDAVQKYCETNSPGQEALRYVVDHTAELKESPLREFVFQALVWDNVAIQLNDDIVNSWIKAGGEVALELYKVLTCLDPDQRHPSKGFACRYHKHNVTNPCKERARDVDEFEVQMLSK